MKKKRLAETVLLAAIQLDKEDATPLYQQLYQAMQQAITAGQLTADLRLPSIRDLSALLNVSRNTITNAFDQLIAEGYLETKLGAGTFVASHPQHRLVTMPSQPFEIAKSAKSSRRYSQRSRLISTASQNWIITNPQNPAFQYGLPALDHFPHETWAKLTAQRHRRGYSYRLNFSSAVGGYYPLREAIVEYLKLARGVKCQPDQVIITSGAHQGIYLAAQILLDPGDQVLLADPGFTSAQRTFASVGASIIPVPLDEQGLDIDQLPASSTDSHVAFVKASRHHPVGVTMTLARRLALLEWAERVNGWIIEDDYDSAFTYNSPPVPAIQGLDSHQRVIYLGSFSKVIFPSLRLGYLVAPEDLVDKFLSLRSIVDSYIPTMNQIVLTDFIERGHFSRHLRRMRHLYAQRQAFFLHESKCLLDGLLDVETAHAGTSVAAWLPHSVSDVQVQRLVLQQGITVMPISPCYISSVRQQGLLFGYAACDEAAIQIGLQQVKGIIEQVQRAGSTGQ